MKLFGDMVQKVRSVKRVMRRLEQIEDGLFRHNKWMATNSMRIQKLDETMGELANHGRHPVAIVQLRQGITDLEKIEEKRYAFLVSSVDGLMVSLSEAKASIVELEKRVSAMEGDKEALRRWSAAVNEADTLAGPFSVNQS